jgi:cysteine desulfurase family protein (TIGR01976 family)
MTSDTPPLPRQDQVRQAFPALASGVIFLENAGGSQVPACVSDAIHRYMRQTYVQLGAGYPLSDSCTRTVDEAHEFAGILVGASAGQAIIGASTTALLNMLAGCYARVLQPGQEIVLAETGHEANLGPWKRLEALGLTLRWWRLDRQTLTLRLEDLDRLLSRRTALVAVPHVSNLLGGVLDLAAVCRAAHAVGARVVADGVAYAPHRAVDVSAWDVDWYALSAYKVYGPHMGVLYGKDEALAELPGPNHFFIGRDEGPYYFEPGGASHEGCAGLLALGEYLSFVAGRDPAAPCQRSTVEQACAQFQRWERPCIDRLLAYLGDQPQVQVLGPDPAHEPRVGTVSFAHRQKTSREIAAAVNRTEVAIRNGHMYAYHLCQALGLEPADGVVRISLVHYNTPAEIERLLEVLEAVL